MNFKQFLTLDEEQLNEIFGIFRNNKNQNAVKRSRNGQNEADKETEWKIAKAIADKKRPLSPREKEAIKRKMWSDSQRGGLDDLGEAIELASDDEHDWDYNGMEKFSEPFYVKYGAGKDGSDLIRATINGHQREFYFDFKKHQFENEHGEPLRRGHSDIQALNQLESWSDFLHKMIARHLEK